MRPFDHLREQLNREPDEAGESMVRGDSLRGQRTGAPEVIYAAHKSIDQILAGLSSLIATNGRVVISQLPPALRAQLEQQLPDDCRLVLAPGERAGVVIFGNATKPTSGGRVAVLTAGTSDIPVAAEAALIAAETGCEIRTTWDVGVAGIHRLVHPLETMIAWDPDVFIVAAGMDGILPTIVSGLVRQPIVALPTSTGYGFGGEGLGALTTMLQSCSPGLVVVNIDNGIGAGISAARIALRVAQFRSGPS